MQWQKTHIRCRLKVWRDAQLEKWNYYFLICRFVLLWYNFNIKIVNVIWAEPVKVSLIAGAAGAVISDLISSEFMWLYEEFINSTHLHQIGNKQITQRQLKMNEEQDRSLYLPSRVTRCLEQSWSDVAIKKVEAMFSLCCFIVSKARRRKKNLIAERP